MKIFQYIFIFKTFNNGLNFKYFNINELISFGIHYQGLEFQV